MEKNGFSSWVSSSTTVRKTQVDVCWYWTSHIHTHYQHLGHWGYKRGVGRSVLCRKFQETANMLRFLVLTSLAALGKISLIPPLLWHSAHTHTHARLLIHFKTWCLTVMLPPSLLCSVLAELEPQPRYLEDDSPVEKVVGGEVASPNSWPWQVMWI